MVIKTATVWPVNELGEIVAQVGTGTANIVGYLDDNFIPTDTATSAAVFRFPPTSGGTTNARLEATNSPTQPQGAAIQAFLNDPTKKPLYASLGYGDFYVDQDILLHSQVLGPADGYGYGFRVVGQGMAYTRLIDIRADRTNPMIQFTDPVGASVGGRDYNMNIMGFSCLSANTSGVLNPAGTLTGSAMAFQATVGTGFNSFVNHTFTLYDIQFNGFVNSVILDNCTQPRFDQCWFRECQRGVWSGGNNDMAKFNNCRFGAESQTYNGMTAFDTSYSGRIGFTGGGDGIEFNSCWFMGLGKVLWANTGAENTVSFNSAYFERCLQYIRYEDGLTAKVRMTACQFSLATTNDSAAPKISLGNGSSHDVQLVACAGGGATAGPLIGNSGTQPRIVFDSCNIGTGTNGHYKWIDPTGTTANDRVVTLPESGRGTIKLGGTYGLTNLTGNQRVITKGTTGAITCDHWEGDTFSLPALTGSVTITITGGAVPAAIGTRYRFRIQSSATSPDTKTVTFAANINFPTAFVQPPATPVSAYTLVEVEKVGSGYIVVSPTNIWVA